MTVFDDQVDHGSFFTCQHNYQRNLERSIGIFIQKKLAIKILGQYGGFQKRNKWLVNYILVSKDVYQSNRNYCEQKLEGNNHFTSPQA